MNREIKFRAWDKDSKIMKNIEFISLPLNKPNGKDICATDLEDNDISEWIYDYKLMQYTGLKDKNGVEIYEGDIVSSEDYIIGEVIYGDDSCNYSGCWLVKTKRNQMLLNDYRDEFGAYMQVIGNIYETPHLLEDSSNNPELLEEER